MIKKQRIRDPLHNLIGFNIDDKAKGADRADKIAWELLQTPQFQRLRRIKQLGFSELTYPGATHTRFTHSIGVFHTARRLMRITQDYCENTDDIKERVALIAALLHDIGHGPFSHAFETFGKKFDLKLASNHESVSTKIILKDEIADIINSGTYPNASQDVADMISGMGNGANTIYRSIVSSKFDADRLDYMRRDRLMCGTEHSAIDFSWLLDNLEVGTVSAGDGEDSDANIETFVIGTKAIPAAEAYVTGLFDLYPTVYFHKATRGAEIIFTEIMSRAYELVADQQHNNTGLPAHHPLVQFCKKPEEIETIQALDDTVIWGALPLFMSSSDPVLSELSGRLLNRNLFKCYDVREKVVQLIDPQQTGDEAKKIDQVCASVMQKFEDMQSEESQKGNLPRLFVDKTKRNSYSDGDEKNPIHTQQINVRLNDGRFIDLKRRSKTVQALGVFEVQRVYYNKDDKKVFEDVTQMIEDAVKQWGKQ